MIRIVEKIKSNVKTLDDIDENAYHVVYQGLEKSTYIVIKEQDTKVAGHPIIYRFLATNMIPIPRITFNSLEEALQCALSDGFEVYEFPTKLEMYQWLTNMEVLAPYNEGFKNCNDDVKPSKPTNIEPHQDYSWEELDDDLQELAQDYIDDDIIDETEPNYYYKQ